MIAIAQATFKEAVRKKIIILIGILTLIYLIMLSVITYFGFQDLKKSGVGSDIILSNAALIVSFLGFYFSSMIIALFTIMASLGAISTEIENGTIHSIVSKPLKRSQYVMGKYLGLAVLATVYSVFLYLAIIIINYAIGVPPLDKPNILLLSKGLALFILEPLSILALCICGSVYFRTLNNGIIVIAIYILGIIGSMMEQIGSALKMDGLVQWGILISLVSPFDTVYKKMIDVIYSGSNMTINLSSPLFLSGTVPSNWMMLYVIVFLTVMLMFAVRKFNRKDIS